MAEVARLVGKEVREYEKDGRKRQYCGLHLMYVENTVQGVEGCKVEALSCPREIDPYRLKVGSLYQLDYEIYTMKGQRMARLSNLLPVEE